ncbi:MAG: DCC1-like thiol-disulfide oxidoreductase family protein [Minicystis sp.]
MAKAIRDHYFRIDARSLGLFRLSFGVVLLWDLFRRWRWAKELYSNEGVLPNHNHLFNLQNKEQVWSLLHSISSPGEADAAFCVILFVYLCFFIGWKTRAFHVVALVCLVSLTGRNILLEGVGNYVAIALLAFTAFLPLGSRFSLDSLRASMAARDEKNAKDLNDRRRPSAEAIDAARVPGWSPASLAALAVLGQIAVIYLVAALQQKSEGWRDGSALHYALNAERWVSAAGASVRGSLGPGALSAWTRVFRAAEWAVPVLIFIPVFPRITRGLAVGLALFHALTMGIFFAFGLYGWSLAAASLLLIPTETWEAIAEHANPRRARTVIYDADCGVCLWLTRLLKRLDIRGNLTFQGNDDLDGLNRRKGAEITRAELPKEVTVDLVSGTVVVVDPEGRVHTRANAVAEAVQALPLGWAVAWIMRLPGIVNLLGALYDFIAERRMRISVAMGKEACGIPGLGGEEQAEVDPSQIDPPAPAARLARGVTGALRDLAVSVVFAAMLAQTAHENPIGWSMPRPSWLAAVATWPRMMARWDVMGTLPTEDEVMVVDGQTKDGRGIDPLTGREPVFDPGAMRGTGLGQLWNDYLWRIHQKEWSDFQRAFRDYLIKTGPMWDVPTGDGAIVGYDVYWIKQPIPKPGEQREKAVSGREKLWTQSRGGRLGIERALPLLRPNLQKR